MDGNTDSINLIDITEYAIDYFASDIHDDERGDVDRTDTDPDETEDAVFSFETASPGLPPAAHGRF